MRKLLKGLVIPLLLWQLWAVSAAAEITEEVALQKETSVVQMVVFYTDENGEEYPVQGGSGFLIGDEESGAEYMITAKEITSVDKETEAQLIALYVEDESDAKLTYITKAVIKRDVMIEVQLVAESDEMGFAVWKLTQPLYDRAPLILCDQPVTGISGQKATVLGFPTAPSLTGETVYYAMDELIFKEGMFIGDGKEENITYLYHNMDPNPGMIGGPILNEEGNVVAVNQSKEAQNGYYALQISELLPVLEALGIPCITTGEIEAQKQAELAAMVHKEELQAGIQTAEAIDSSLYFKDSYAVLEVCLANAKAINENEEAAQEEVDAALNQLKASVTDLEPKPPLWIVITVVAAVVLVLTIVFIVVWKKTKTGREAKKRKKMADFTVTQAAPVFAESVVQKEDYRKLVAQSSGELQGRIPADREMTQGCDETTVFQQEPASSMSLRQEEKITYAYLIRKCTGEQIAITEKEFVLGKDPSQTDYCITGNSAISRAHAVIICSGPEVDVSDKNATNGTFVNGIKVNAFQKTALREGDILRLADEEFEFKRS